MSNASSRATMNAALDEALQRHVRLPPEYQNGLSNHLPMVLHTLNALGADADRLQSYAEKYVQRFNSADSPPAGYSVLVRQYADWLQTRGTDETLRRALPELWSGVAAGAFHGLIRTAHAVQSGNHEELAQALAYWAWRSQPTLSPEPARPLLSPVAWTAELQAQAGTWRSPKGLIADRMADVQSTPAYVDLAGRLQAAPGDITQTLRVLAAFAADRYVVSRNLTVLHMVTACRAARVLAPWLADTPAQRGQLARAYAAAYLSCGTGAVTPPEPAATATWETVVAAALVSDDDHVVKMVHACRETEALGWPGPWLAAATRAVRVPHAGHTPARRVPEECPSQARVPRGAGR
jgi:hypothetical protein